MAIINPRETTVTRFIVQQWLDEFKESGKDESELRAFLEEKISIMGVEDTEVDTTENEYLRDITPLVDMILMDLDSYA